jgi:glutamyl-tRNA reductase
VAVELARQLFADIASSSTLVIGAGEMGELLIQHLRSAGCSDIAVINRSYDRAAEMAQRYGVRAAAWDGVHTQLAAADIAITCASAQDYLFTKQYLAAAMNGRTRRPLLIIDIAVPPNVEPSVNEIEDVYLYSLDELAKVAEENRKVRQEDIVKGMRIIHENVAEFMDWFRARDIGPLIGEMKQQFARISDDELSRFFVGRRANASCRDVMEPTVKRIINRLLHCVIKNVDTVAREHGPAEAAKLVEDIIRQANEVSSGRTDPEEIEP